MTSAPTGTDADAAGGGSWRARLFGGRDRLGWWLLPLFLMVGLGGAVLAGSLAVVYYAQQVSQLESETREAREDLVGAADEVREAADEALAAIDEEAAEVRSELARGLPLEDALEVGVVRLEIDTQLEERVEPTVGPAAAGPVQAAAVTDEAQDPEQGEDGADPDDDGDTEAEVPAPEDDVPDDEPNDDAEPDVPAEPETRQVPLRRTGTGFVVVVDGGTAYLAASLGLLDDPRTDDRVPADVEVTVRLSAGSTTATIHSWDEQHDLLLLQASIDNVQPLEWREEGDDVAPGDRVVAVGATPDLAPVRIGAEVAGVSPGALVTSLPSLDLIDGGPVVDGDGAVVGVAVSSHTPLGGDPVVVPVRRLCDQLLSTCPD